MSIRIGAHVDSSDAVEQAKAIGAEVAQVFLGDPQSWKVTGPDYPGGPEALKEDAAAAGIDLYVHSPYGINVASTNNRIRIPSRKLLQATLEGAAAIGAKGVVVHGGHVTAKDAPDVGFDNWRKAIDSLDTDIPVLIENTAGGDFAMARQLERIEQLWGAVMSSVNASVVGFTLDTCHAWAGGIDLASAVEDIRAITGRIDLVHANDSRDVAGSGGDRHAHFGEGEIPADLLLGVVKAAGAPVVCETHGDMAPDIAWLRSRLGA